MYCENCGKEIDNNETACPNCGYTVNPVESSTVKSAAPPPDESIMFAAANRPPLNDELINSTNLNNRKKNKRKTIAGIISILIILATVIAAGSYLYYLYNTFLPESIVGFYYNEGADDTYKVLYVNPDSDNDGIYQCTLYDIPKEGNKLSAISETEVKDRLKLEKGVFLNSKLVSMDGNVELRFDFTINNDGPALNSFALCTEDSEYTFLDIYENSIVIENYNNKLLDDLMLDYSVYEINCINVINEFEELQWNNPVSTPIMDVIDEVFIDYNITVDPIEEDDGSFSNNKYVVTVSGTYCPNAYNLPEYTEEGEISIAVNLSDDEDTGDYQTGDIISDDGVSDAFYTYLVLSTNWRSYYSSYWY